MAFTLLLTGIAYTHSESVHYSKELGSDVSILPLELYSNSGAISVGNSKVGIGKKHHWRDSAA